MILIIAVSLPSLKSTEIYLNKIKRNCDQRQARGKLRHKGLQQRRGRSIWGQWPLPLLLFSGSSDWQGLCLLTPHTPPANNGRSPSLRLFIVKTAQTLRQWHRKGMGGGLGC